MHRKTKVATYRWLTLSVPCRRPVSAVHAHKGCQIASINSHIMSFGLPYHVMVMTHDRKSPRLFRNSVLLCELTRGPGGSIFIYGPVGSKCRTGPRHVTMLSTNKYTCVRTVICRCPHANTASFLSPLQTDNASSPPGRTYD
jgi:hypothetical protein